MAARKRKGLSENTRQRIQTSMLVNRLEKHALGELKLTTSQIKAIEVLIRKTLPDLTAVHSTEGAGQSYEDWLDDLPERTPSTD